MEKETTERILLGASLGVIMFAYAAILYTSAGGFEIGAFIIWVQLSMLTAIFYIMVNIRNTLLKQNKILKEGFENGLPTPQKKVEITMPINVNAEEKPTKKRK